MTTKAKLSDWREEFNDWKKVWGLEDYIDQNFIPKDELREVLDSVEKFAELARDGAISKGQQDTIHEVTDSIKFQLNLTEQEGEDEN